MIRGVLLTAALLAAHVAHAAGVSEVHYVMGTYFHITAEHADAPQARRAMRRCFAAARRLDEAFSRFDPASELSRVNARASDQHAVGISAEMAALLRRSLELQALTDGAFDPGVGALTQLWRTASAWPPAAAVTAARDTAGTGSLTLRGATLVRRRGALLDLDGIAKGWAVDGCVSELRAAGIRRAFLNFGESSLYAIGAPSGRREWEVTLRGLDADHALGALMVRDEAVSVSSVLGHERRIGARRVGHIVDPRTGWPLTSPATAVVVAASATDAEAFSKALLLSSNASSASIESVCEAPIAGALLITPGSVQRRGRVAFTAFKTARPITAAAEPLR